MTVCLGCAESDGLSSSQSELLVQITASVYKLLTSKNTTRKLLLQTEQAVTCTKPALRYEFHVTVSSCYFTNTVCVDIHNQMMFMEGITPPKWKWKQHFQ